MKIKNIKMRCILKLTYVYVVLFSYVLVTYTPMVYTYNIFNSYHYGILLWLELSQATPSFNFHNQSNFCVLVWFIVVQFNS